jgi:hypothetical protein
LPKVNIGSSLNVPRVSNAGPGRIVTYGTGTRNATHESTMNESDATTMVR